MRIELNRRGDEARELNRAMFYMMHVAFVEIRAAETLSVSRKLADVFHNLPMMLLTSASAEDDLKIYEEIRRRAKRHGMESYLEALKAKALASIS